jgi:hypothetical protein
VLRLEPVAVEIETLRQQTEQLKVIAALSVWVHDYTCLIPLDFVKRFA